MPEFTIMNRLYRTRRMSAENQFHVARRLTPILAKLPDIIGMTLSQCIDNAASLFEHIGTNLDTIQLDVIAATLNGLRNEDVDYIFHATQEAADIRDESGIWAPVRARGRLMYDFIGMSEALGIAFNVARYNLADFFSANDLHSTSTSRTTDSPTPVSPMEKGT